ncbi:MAG TPA: FMN-binding protein [Candidatus Saccharimonadia bacterium]|nr:FMN-binding protein [Candidatus Saccharimonadia bacterium]
MKKYILIVAILGVFVIYSAGIRHQVPMLKKPASLISSGTTSGSASSSSGSSTSSSNSSQYKDGTYTGSIANAYYGNVQVAITISGSKITNVKFLQYPNTHSTSVIINQQAMPYLRQEAIQAQSSNVQLISGATFTSQAFVQSLQAALSQS